MSTLSAAHGRFTHDLVATFCLFYVMAELWGSVVVSLLFWGFANQVQTFLVYHQALSEKQVAKAVKRLMNGPHSMDDFLECLPYVHMPAFAAFQTNGLA